MSDDIDLRKLNTGYKRRKPNVPFDRVSIYLTQPLINRAKQTTKRLNFISLSDFVRYAVRKELDYLDSLSTIPKIKQDT